MSGQIFGLICRNGKNHFTSPRTFVPQMRFGKLIWERKERKYGIQTNVLRRIKETKLKLLTVKHNLLTASQKYLHISLSEWKEMCLAAPKKSNGKEEEPFKYYATYDHHQQAVIQQI